MNEYLKEIKKETKSKFWKAYKMNNIELCHLYQWKLKAIQLLMNNEGSK